MDSMACNSIEMVNPYVVGKKIYLRSPTEEDAEGSWYEWFSKEDTTKMLNLRFWPNTKKEQLEFYNSLHNNKSKLVLSIIEKSSNKHIGVVSLSSINWVHRYAEMGIVIGESEFNNGYFASEACAMILRVAFLRLNLLNVQAGYIGSNMNSKALLKVFKFKNVGAYKNLMTIDGREEDMVLVCLDRDSWIKRNINGK